MPTSSSTYSTPLASQAAISSSLIGREASETSAPPSQNVAKPSPVPGPSTVTARPPPDISLASSPTRMLIGSTVDEPVTKTSPSASSRSPPPPAAVPPVVVSVAPPVVAGAPVVSAPPVVASVPAVVSLAASSSSSSPHAAKTSTPANAPASARRRKEKVFTLSTPIVALSVTELGGSGGHRRNHRCRVIRAPVNDR